MKKHPPFRRSIRLFLRRIRSLLFNPVFLALTVFGNMLIIVGASSLYICEHGKNPQVKSLLDTVWWAVSTVTTVGYGDVTPTTPEGRVIGIIMMIVGTALFWSYTALFAQALVTEEIADVEDELRSLSRRLRDLPSRTNEESKRIVDLIQAVERALEARSTQPVVRKTETF